VVQLLEYVRRSLPVHTAGADAEYQLLRSSEARASCSGWSHWQPDPVRGEATAVTVSPLLPARVRRNQRGGLFLPALLASTVQNISGGFKGFFPGRFGTLRSESPVQKALCCSRVARNCIRKLAAQSERIAQAPPARWSAVGLQIANAIDEPPGRGPRVSSVIWSFLLVPERL